jgi:signal transduction histidine kinase
MSLVEIIYLSSSLLTLAVGLIILRLNPSRTINQAYAIAVFLASGWLICIFMAIHSDEIANTKDAVGWIRLANACSAFLPWSYYLTKIAIMGVPSLAAGIKRSWTWLLAGLLLAMIVYSGEYIPQDSTSDQQKRGLAYFFQLSAIAGLCASLLIDSIRDLRACTGVRLLELKFFVLNVCLTTLVILTSFSLSRILNIPFLRNVGPFFVFLSYSFTVWAICYHRVFDARQLFASLSRRLSSLVFLTSIILLGNALISPYTSVTVSLVVSSCIGGIATYFWDKQIYRWLDLDPRDKLAAPRAKIIKWAREEADAEKLTERFEEYLRDWCHTDYAKIYTIENQNPPGELLKAADYPASYPILKEQGYITSETLARLRPHATNNAGKDLLRQEDLGAIIAVPRGSHSPSCVVALGHKQSLRPYTYPDIQLLIELIEVMDNTLAHSRVASHAARLETMESAAMMSRGLAHDLNNLTTPVSTFLMYMETRVQPGSLEADVLNDAQYSIKVMQDYIRESLFFASRLAPDFRDHSTTQFISSVIKVTQQRALARGVILEKGTIQELMVKADEALLCRLLQNLAFNAIDATPRGGRVVLAVTAVDNNKVCFQVSDQGPGIPPAIMDKLFEPYFTTKDTGNEIRGLGLGLAISQKISVLHSGEIKVSNSAMGGTTFSFILPSEQKARAAQPAATIPENQVTIKPPTAAPSGAPA